MTKTFNYSIQEVFEACKTALNDLYMDINYADLSEKLIVAKTSTSWLSWGETIEITFEKVSSKKTSIEVESNTSGQLITWGVNESNEKKIIQNISKILKA